MASYIDAFADALQAPLRNALCSSTDQLLDRWLTAGVTALSGNLLPYYFQDFLWPNDCGIIPPQEQGRPPNGQCPGVLYNVAFDRYNANGTLLPRVTFANVVGPIVGFGTEWTPDFFGTLFPTTVLQAPNDTEPPTPGTRRFGQWGSADPGRRSRSVIVSIVRVDGQPDTCTGGPVPPPVPPPPPSGIPLPPFNFEFGPFNVPVTGSINVGPVIFAPIIPRFVLPVTVNINPSVAFPVGAQFPVNVNLPDFEINVPISFFPIDLTVLTEPPVRCIGGGGEGCDCEDIREIVFEELDNKFPPTRPNSVDVIGYSAATSRVITLPQFSEWIRLQLVDIPGNARTQFGVDAPDVVYAGWCSFGSGTTGGERIPVSYGGQSLPVPPGADTFSYTLYTGFTATVQVSYIQEDS